MLRSLHGGIRISSRLRAEPPVQLGRQPAGEAARPGREAARLAPEAAPLMRPMNLPPLSTPDSFRLIISG